MLNPSSALTFTRRFAIALLAVVVLTAVGFVSANAYGKREFGQSATVRIPDGLLQPVSVGQPANYLLIGSDIRPADETAAEKQEFGTDEEVGSTGRSDVMMVLHIDPLTRAGMLVSFPRDLLVQIPGHGLNLLNAAFSFGGPALVIQTMEQNFKPLRINHYLEVNFRSFKSIVDAIGHVHIWFPTPVEDPFTGLVVPKAGCVSLDGDQALAYARSRHYNIPTNLADPAPWNPVTHKDGTVTSQGWVEDPLEDLDRIPRQQYFLRTLSAASTTKTGQDPTKILALLGAVFDNLKRDPGLSYTDVKELALTFRGFNPAKVEMSTLPISASPYPQFSGQVIPKYPDAQFVINNLANFTPPKKAIVNPLRADLVKVRVVNGSGVKNAGADALNAFIAAGFRSPGPAEDADRSDYETQVRYAPGKFDEGYTVAVAAGTLNLVPATTAKNTLGGDVLLIVGTDYSSLHHRFDLIPKPLNIASSTTSPGTTGATPTTVGPASTTTTATTTTTYPTTVNTNFVPVDPKTGGALVGCPS